MSGRRTKLLRTQALEYGLDLSTRQIKGQGLPNLFRRMKKNYHRVKK